MSKVHRFIPAAQRAERDAASSAAEYVRSVPSDRLSEAERSIMLRALGRLAEPEAPENRFWKGTYTMLNRAQTAQAWKAVDDLPGKDRPRQVRRVLDQVILNMGFDTGELSITRDQIAEAVGCTVGEVSKAMGILEKIGVIVRSYERVSGMRGRGKAVYSINPHVAWTGDLATAAARARESQTAPLPLFAVI
jgi:hypothetical protein